MRIVRKPDRKIQITTNSQIGILPRKLDELIDVNISEVSGDKDKYVLQYNASTQKWESVNPDEILDAAVREAVQVGLTTTFIDAVRDELYIDLGSF